ncbi:MAG: GNAT family N-acetyltransferase [Actinomycetia bacterium]|nr:GNAT family N-acetyltransferase [Actinomycetes bacterium]
MGLPADYPEKWETHAILADGVPIELRPIRPEDRDNIDAFHRRQSRTSIYYRYFQYRPKLSPRELDRLTQVDYRGRMAFVAMQGDELIAVGRYEQPATEFGQRYPEVAFFVDDNHHRRGLATLLLEYLAAAGRENGHHHFNATVLPENHGMLRVFRRAGFEVTTRFDDGVIEVEIDISVTPESKTASADRESLARTRSVARLLEPSSLAIVGASRRVGSVGHELARSIRAGGFAGATYHVNPAADEVLGERAWPSLRAIGEPVDLAIVAVPAVQVEGVVLDAVKAGVSGLLIVSSGFSETGGSGAERERQLVAEARSNGIRIVGPNAFGMVNTASEIRLRALFLPLAPEAGSVAVVSHSGPLGSAMLDHLTRSGVGLSSFVAVGNRADVSVNDLLDYWRIDPATKVILAYVENFGNLRNFALLARAVSVEKPIVTVRPPVEELVDLLSQAGVIITDGVSELAEVAQLLVEQSLPKGNRVAVVTNSASVGRLTVAACRRHGLDVVVPASIEHHHDSRPDDAKGFDRVGGAILVDDVDTSVAGTGSIDPEQILVAAAVASEVDALLIAMVPTFKLPFSEMALMIDRVNGSVAKPVVATGLVGPDQLTVPGVPTFAFPEEAARTLGLVAAHGQWRQANHRATLDDVPGNEPVEGEIELGQRIRPQVLDWLGDRETIEVNLLSPQARAAIDLLELPVPGWRVAPGVAEAMAAAGELGYPVVLKAGAAPIRSIGEAGGVAIDLYDRDQLALAYERMASADPKALSPVLVQAMVPSVGNLKIELVQEASLGSFITIGIGGIAGRRLPDTARLFLPVGGGEVGAALDDLDLIDDARSRVGALVGHLGRLGVAVPELARVTLDPVLVAGSATAAGDVEIVIRRWRRDPLEEVRRL